MSTSTSEEVTQLLAALSRGDKDALSRLLPRVYDELHAIAGRAMRHERGDHTLQTTALVNEAYLKLVDQSRAQWQHRSQFFGVAAQVMRRILVDHARARQAAKRGGGAPEGEQPGRAKGGRVSLEVAEAAAAGGEVPGAGTGILDVVALDDALVRLAAMDPQQARIVELRFFGGLTVEQTADLLDISPATVKRDWTVAKAWLHREIAGNDQ